MRGILFILIGDRINLNLFSIPYISSSPQKPMEALNAKFAILILLECIHTLGTYMHKKNVATTQINNFRAYT